MLVSIHVITGAIIGKSTNDPVLASLAAFGSHFILDMIPHGDEHLLACPDRCNPKIKKFLTLIKIDSLIAALLIVFILLSPLNNRFVVGLAIFGSVLPDILAGIHELGDLKQWRKRYFNNFWRFHRYTHNHIIRWQPGFRLGLLIQSGFLYLLLKFAR